MKKKIASLLLVLIMCVSVFTGCSLVTVNEKSYFEAVVATITYSTGETENITKRDLISAYNSYGYNYVENYDYTKEKAVDTTIETLINKKLTIKAVEDYYKNNPQEGKILNERETTYLWDETYKALYDNMKTYFKEVIGDKSSTAEDEEEANKSIFTPYEKTAYLDYDKNGKLIIRKTTKATTIRESYDARKNEAGEAYDYELETENKFPFKEEMFEKLTSIVVGDEQSELNWKSAFNNYIADIKENYTYKEFKDDKDTFFFEMDRVYNILKDNYMTEKYSAIYNASKHEGADYANISVDEILKAYSANVRADYTKYNLEANSSYETDMLSSISTMDYVLENGSQFFYTAYIKLEFNAEQKNLYEELKTSLEDGTITQDVYEERLTSLYNSVYATIRDAETGEKTDKKIGSQKLLNEINTIISNYKYLTVQEYIKDMPAEEKVKAEENATLQGVTLEQYCEAIVQEYNVQVGYDRADAFRKYLYLYNDDDTLKGADYNAVFGINSSNEILLGDTFKDNEDVENAIKDLMASSDVKIGDTTDFVRADDGLYMFFYAGEITNVFDGITQDFDASKRPESIKKLASTRFNIFSEKTIFDSLYTSLVKDKFSVFENMNINYLRGYAKNLEKIENNYKDM